MREIDRAENVRRRTARRDPDHYITRGEACGSKIPRAIFGGVLGAFDRATHGFRAAGNERLHHLGARAESRGALGSVQNRETAAGACTDVKKSATICEAANDRVHGSRDLRQLPMNSVRYALIFAIQDAKNLERRFFIEPSRARVRTFGSGRFQPRASVRVSSIPGGGASIGGCERIR